MSVTDCLLWTMCLCLSVCPLVYLCCFITVFCIRANKELYIQSTCQGLHKIRCHGTPGW